MAAKSLHDESVLIGRIAEGDQHAFRIVFEFYYQKVYSFSLNILRDRMAAEEVVQETMLKFWKTGRGLYMVKNLDTYLRKMARNRCIDILRRKSHWLNIESELAADWRELHNETEEQILLKDTRKLLNDGISLLPDQQRAVYILCHVEGMKYEEAAMELGLSAETVKFYMKLALRFLRNYLNRHTDVVALLIIFNLL